MVNANALLLLLDVTAVNVVVMEIAPIPKVYATKPQELVDVRVGSWEMTVLLARVPKIVMARHVLDTDNA